MMIAAAWTASWPRMPWTLSSWTPARVRNWASSEACCQYHLYVISDGLFLCNGPGRPFEEVDLCLFVAVHCTISWRFCLPMAIRGAVHGQMLVDGQGLWTLSGTCPYLLALGVEQLHHGFASVTGTCSKVMG